MISSRRNFLGLLAAGLALDPERLLWVLGARLILIPKPSPLTQTVTFSGVYIREPLMYPVSGNWATPGFYYNIRDPIFGLGV